MWGGYNVVTPAVAVQPQSQQKHDIFVGNLAFHTTEDQLHQAFSEIGRVIKVRLVTDAETGKPRGFAFVEFEDPQAALSAIRNMNDYELNGRRLRVNFSNSSHLEALAGKLGMDLSQQTSQRNNQSSSAAQLGSAGTQQVADALKGMSKGEMYDVVSKLKEMADRDPDEARKIISSHPQLPEAILFLMSKLDMVRDNPNAAQAAAAAVVPPPTAAVTVAPPRVDPRARAADPRAAAAASIPAVPPPAAAPPPRADPRARLDPRARAAAATTTGTTPSYPPPPQPPAYMPAQQQAPPPPPSGVANLDPALVQQVMSLTPIQISQLPPDKQQSIMALRQQISGAGR